MDSLGDGAIELMRMAGKPLDPWQEDACHLMMARRADERWACFEYAEWVARQNGKGALIEARVLAGLFLFGEQLIMWSAHEYKTAMDAFRRMRNLLRVLGEEVSPNLIMVGEIPVRVVGQNGEESFERSDTGQLVKFIARSKGSGRGFSPDVQIIDEAFAYTTGQQEALMPTLNARPNPQIIYMSSPPLDGDSGEPMFALRERADAGGDDSLGYRDWGVAGDLKEVEEMPQHEQARFLDDVERWAATNPAMGTRPGLTEEKLLRNRRSMSPVGFAREILGIWPRQAVTSGRVIDLRAWAELADTSSQLVGSMVFGLDANPERSRSAIGSAGLSAGGVGHVEVVDARPGTGWVVPRVLELDRRWRPKAWVIDPASAAGAWITDLQEAGIEPVLVTGREMAQACGAFHQAATETKSFRHLDQPELNAAVVGAKAKVASDAFVWDRRHSGVSISELVAVTLAHHGFTKHGHTGAPNLW